MVQSWEEVQTLLLKKEQRFSLFDFLYNLAVDLQKYFVCTQNPPKSDPLTFLVHDQTKQFFFR